MKTLIVYSSQSDNTKKLAEAAYQAIEDEKSIFPVDEAPTPEGYDLLMVGFWLMGGKPDPKSSAYIAKAGRIRLFLFATHGAAADSPHARNAMDRAISLAPSARLVGTFNCPGQVNPSFLEKVKIKNPPPPWISDAPAAEGHPDASDIEQLTAAVQAAVIDDAASFPI